MINANRRNHPLVSWRSVLAGLIASLLCYALLMTLGLAIGGLSLESVIQNGAGGGFSIGAAVWVLVATLVSLYVGSYFAARVSNFITFRIGAAQGIVISALFFGVMAMQVTSSLGWAGRGISSLVGSVGSSLKDVGSNSMVQDTLESAIADLNLQASPQEVAQGLATRLLRGETTSARNYLARQAGMSPDEAESRIASLNQEFQAQVQTLASQAGELLSIAAWVLFGLMLLGTGAAALGGGSGSRENVKHPYREQEESERPTLLQTGS